MSLYLYNITLQKPGYISHAIVGNFSEHPENDLLISRGRSIELRRYINEKLQLIHSVDVFGIIRSLTSLKIDGMIYYIGIIFDIFLIKRFFF